MKENTPHERHTMTTQTTTCAYVGTYNCDCGAPLDAREDMTNRPYGITTCTRSKEVVLSGPATQTPDPTRAARRAVMALAQHAHDTRMILKDLGYQPAQSVSDVQGLAFDQLAQIKRTLTGIVQDMR